ncbi:hypothetical protein CMUS01_15694 [Colletotrichum musicola]|uniref:Uncharacterized protein n=1 Tax=Colletotrichum musicola TaxID=2175873 RepID=A0A8H6MM44_9PEZI|nr:hypothetical protein CMUS01_15694 [Colletotrichum musicola]
MGAQSLRQIFLVLILSLIHLRLVSAACQPARDRTTCPATTWKAEYGCLMWQNTITGLINCVRTNVKNDDKLCQDIHDDIPDQGTELYWAAVKPAEARCSTARQVLLAGSDYPDCKACSLRGLIQACPDNDPNFWNCLCEYNITPDQFNCLSRCFGKPAPLVKEIQLECPHWRGRGKKKPMPAARPARRPARHPASPPAVPFVGRRPGVGRPGVRRQAAPEEEWIIDQWDRTTWITSLGRAIVWDEATERYIESPLPLPYKEYMVQNADGSPGRKRCVVHPRDAAEGCYDVVYDVEKRADGEYDNEASQPSRGYASFSSSTTFNDGAASATDGGFASIQTPTSISTISMRTALEGETLSLIEPTRPAQFDAQPTLPSEFYPQPTLPSKFNPEPTRPSEFDPEPISAPEFDSEPTFV